WARGDHADYDTGKGVLVLTGNPEARQGTNTMKGDRVVFYVDIDLIEVERVKGVLESKGKEPQPGQKKPPVPGPGTKAPGCRTGSARRAWSRPTAAGGWWMACTWRSRPGRSSGCSDRTGQGRRPPSTWSWGWYRRRQGRCGSARWSSRGSPSTAGPASAWDTC